MATEFQALVPYFINFSIVVVLVYLVGRKPVRKYAYQRHERLRDAIEGAAMSHAKALERVESARRALAAVASEDRALVAREVASADLERAEIMQRAQAEALRVSREAERLAVAEQDEAAERVKQQFLDLVVREAEEKLKRGLKKDDHSAILKRAQNSIEVGV